MNLERPNHVLEPDFRLIEVSFLSNLFGRTRVGDLDRDIIGDDKIGFLPRETYHHHHDLYQVAWIRLESPGLGLCLCFQMTLAFIKLGDTLPTEEKIDLGLGTGR